MENVYIGVDNGISGGLVAISSHHGLIVAKLAMPSSRHRSRNEINIRAVHIWLSDVTGGNLSNAEYIIEEPNNSRTVSTAYSVASSFHSMRGFFEAKLLHFHRVTPQAWQKAMLGKVDKGETKNAASIKARELWPDEKWLPTKRHRTPSDGLVDAALIAQYARINQL